MDQERLLHFNICFFRDISYVSIRADTGQELSGHRLEVSQKFCYNYVTGIEQYI